MTRERMESFSELSQFELDPASIQLLSKSFCERERCVVLGRVDPTSKTAVTVGLLDPRNAQVVATIEKRLGRDVKAVGLNGYEIDRALAEGFGGGAPPEKSAREVPRIDLRSAPARDGASPSQLFDDLLAHGLAKGASDIHLECYEDDVDVRLRIDGVLHQLQTPVSPANVKQVVSRIKILADLDIAERRRPLDGRIEVVVVDGGGKTRDVDLRVSTLPGLDGEDVVIRILDPSMGLLSIADLGMSEGVATQFAALLDNPEGMVLVTGPTSSGKTTTLSAAVCRLRDHHRKVITAEDPIEIRIPKVNQKQVDKNLTMADLARAFLRQNPDVMLIGEIRDLVTADTATKAASTGHLVLGTLHTADAFGAITRLRALGVENWDIAEALLGCVSQRLVRRICASCRVEAPPSDSQRALFGARLEGITASRGAGCERCFGSGYKGRTGIYELLVVDEQLQDRIADGVNTSDLRAAARRAGFHGLLEDALAKVAAGATSLDEVVRVLPYRQLRAAAASLSP